MYSPIPIEKGGRENLMKRSTSCAQSPHPISPFQGSDGNFKEEFNNWVWVSRLQCPLSFVCLISTTARAPVAAER